MLDSDAVDLDLYTWERYNQIVEHKTSHYTYYCPLALGCYLADNIAYMTDVQRFAYKIGRLFQAQVRNFNFKLRSYCRLLYLPLNVFYKISPYAGIRAEYLAPKFLLWFVG